jgi:hypothetical protein
MGGVGAVIAGICPFMDFRTRYQNSRNALLIKFKSI